MYKNFMKIRNFENFRIIDFFYKSAFIFLKILFFVLSMFWLTLLFPLKRKLVFTFFFLSDFLIQKRVSCFIFFALFVKYTQIFFKIFYFKKFPYICKFSLALFFLRKTLKCVLLFISLPRYVCFSFYFLY